MSKKEAKILQFRMSACANQDAEKTSRTSSLKTTEEPARRKPLVGPDDIYSQTAKAIDAAGKLDPEVEKSGKEFVNVKFCELENRVDAYRMNAVSRNKRDDLTDSQLCIEMTRTEMIMLVGSTIKNILERSYRNQDLGIFNNATCLSESLLRIVNNERFLPDGNGKRARYSVESDERSMIENIKMNFDYFFNGPLSVYASRYGIELMDFQTLMGHAQQMAEISKSFSTSKVR